MDARPSRPVARFPEAVAEGLDEAMIREVVHHFYAAAREDPVIGPVFRARVPDDRWQAHLDTIEDFWCSSLLGTRRYEGRPMPKHLAISELNDDHFRRWLALFRHTVTQICPQKTAELFVERSERIAEAFRINIGMARGEDLMFRPKLTREPYP
ncbi:group III truncated hemoglobin [Rhodovulum sulfidophilum]|nr:group III truncated hemoglobin [Rhodovulum sulfidophilum]OLS49545.1 preprotein translocase subunit TatC [Rhodovulum sulfidophilum]